MPSHSETPTPPDGLPDSVAETLSELSDEELRKIIVHARELLNAHEEQSFPIEPAPGEDIIRIEEKHGHTEVVKKAPCGEDCGDCPHGPYLYHVTEETLPTGETELHWKFLGEVAAEDE